MKMITTTMIMSISRTMIKTSGTMMATELEPISPPTLTLGSTLVVEGEVALVAIVSEAVVMALPAQTDMPLKKVTNLTSVGSIRLMLRELHH